MRSSTAHTNLKQYWITLSMCEGHLAMWAVRQSPYHCPDHLELVIKMFRCHAIQYFDAAEMRRCDRLDLVELLKLSLSPIPEFRQWNERKNGNKSPYAFVDRYSRPKPDDDFIDLDALILNVARDIIRECEHDDGEPVKRNWLLRIWDRFKLKTPAYGLLDPPTGGPKSD